MGVEYACRKGCSFCCHIRVQVADEEVPRLIEAFKTLPDINTSDMRAVDRHNDEFVDLLKLAPCIALNQATGECNIYESRPAMCRAYHSTNAEDCANNDDRSMVKDPVDLSPRVAYLDEVYHAWRHGESTKIEPIVLAVLPTNLYRGDDKGAEVSPAVYHAVMNLPTRLQSCLIINSETDPDQFVQVSMYSKQIGIESPSKTDKLKLKKHI